MIQNAQNNSFRINFRQRSSKNCGLSTIRVPKVFPSFFRKCIGNNNEILQMNHTTFADMRLFFHNASVIFNTLYQTWVRRYIPVLQNPLIRFLSTSPKTLFQFSSICKMASTYCIHYRAKQMAVGGCQIWAVSRTGKNSPSQFSGCLTCTQAGIVVKEKDVFHVLISTNCKSALSHSV
jgi:hypothetical protein